MTKKQPLFTDEEVKQPVVKKEPLKNIETEEIKAPEGNILKLPSKGAFGYPEQISYRDLLVKDEEVLAGASPTVLSQTLTGVLKSVCNDCDFFEDLTVYDRDFIMVWLAANTYSRYKKVEVECQHCDQMIKANFDLLNGGDLIEPKTDLFPIRIPIQKTGGAILVHLNTVGDELFAESYINNESKKKEAGDLNNEQLMLYRSISIEGAEGLPFKQKVDWIRNNVNPKELGFCKQAHVHGMYGINRVVNMKCESCGGETKMSHPFRFSDFVRPDVHDDFEELLQCQ